MACIYLIVCVKSKDKIKDSKEPKDTKILIIWFGTKEKFMRTLIVALRSRHAVDEV